MINENCKCPRRKCPRHGNCALCRAFHEDPEKAVRFCERIKTTGPDKSGSKTGERTELPNGHPPFDSSKKQTPSP